MRKNIRKALLVCSASPLFMAVLCEKVDELPPLIYNDIHVSVSEASNFSTSDTLWISAKVSSLVFDEGVQDSIRNSNEFVSDIISVLRMKSENRTSNTTEAIRDFEIVTRTGSIDFLGACPESELIANAPLTANRQSYMYEIGLVPINAGDFVLAWRPGSALQNSELNQQILEKYPIQGDTNQLGLTKCGITSTLLDVKSSSNEFFFTVE